MCSTHQRAGGCRVSVRGCNQSGTPATTAAALGARRTALIRGPGAAQDEAAQSASGVTAFSREVARMWRARAPRAAVCTTSGHALAQLGGGRRQAARRARSLQGPPGAPGSCRGRRS